MVTIMAIGDGKCMWCLEATEGVQAQFRDGLSGFLCRKHFWQALQVRGEAKHAVDHDPHKSTKSPVSEKA